VLMAVVQLNLIGYGIAVYFAATALIRLCLIMAKTARMRFDQPRMMPQSTSSSDSSPSSDRAHCSYSILWRLGRAFSRVFFRLAMLVILLGIGLTLYTWTVEILNPGAWAVNYGQLIIMRVFGLSATAVAILVVMVPASSFHRTLSRTRDEFCRVVRESYEKRVLIYLAMDLSSEHRERLITESKTLHMVMAYYSSLSTWPFGRPLVLRLAAGGAIPYIVAFCLHMLSM
ncbi:MAG: hypothetical protein HXY34_07735, partial [Candidatus Thorarchaeota archaeon]|nr:hypothetical protein [Candidatus Thorarchaeota archaeon]